MGYWLPSHSKRHSCSHLKALQGFKARFVDNESQCLKAVPKSPSTMLYWYHSFVFSLIAKRMAPHVEWPLQEEQSVKAEGLTVLCHIWAGGSTLNLNHNSMISSRSFLWHCCRTCRTHHSNINRTTDFGVLVFAEHQSYIAIDFEKGLLGCFDITLTSNNNLTFPYVCCNCRVAVVSISNTPLWLYDAHHCNSLGCISYNLCRKRMLMSTWSEWFGCWSCLGMAHVDA